MSGRYRLIDEVGRGGMSIVWRGHDDVLDRPVAVKMLAPGYADDQAFRERIQREARAAARLSHAHVGTVHDFGEAPDGRPFMVMELIDGESLASRLQAGPLPCDEALTVCAQVAAALAETHAHGLVHRDVKPGNVMLTPSGAKLVDFGISASAGTADTGDRPGLLFGTPAYVAPEVVTGCPAGTAADVYALGILLYRTLTGRLPWPAGTASEVLRAHVLAPPPPLPPVPGLPRRVADLSLRCLAKDPADRPTCAELATAWYAAARRRRRPGPVTVLRAHRHRWAAALGCALLGLGVFGATAALSPDPDRHAPVAAAPSTPPVTCQVLYRLRSDDGHTFAGALTVRNTGGRAVPASTLTFAFPATQQIAGTAFAQRGATVTVPTRALPPGATGSFPFTGRYSGYNAMPTGFALGPIPCDAQTVGLTGQPAVTRAALPAAPPAPAGDHGGGTAGDGAGASAKGPKPKKSHKD